MQIYNTPTKIPNTSSTSPGCSPISPQLPAQKNSPLGNITNFSVNQRQQRVPLTEKESLKLKYDYKKAKIEQKKKIGKLVARVSYCGTRCICKDAIEIDAVKGEKGGIYYRGMQRCGLGWLCPDCTYKLMKTRAEEVYQQLKIYKEKGKLVLFGTFTIQHNKGERLVDVYEKLKDAYNYANSSNKWKEAKKKCPVEYLRALEVLYGSNGWHPHFHSLFVGDHEMINTIQVFISQFSKRLKDKYGLLVNSHTVTMKAWNGEIDTMTDYMFKGMIEKEITGGHLKTGKGKTFFQMIDEGVETKAIKEYITGTKGKQQYRPSENFFDDVEVKTDEEILQDDKVADTLFSIPVKVYADIHRKGIALHLLNEYDHGGKDRAIKLLELYDCDTGFLESV